MVNFVPALEELHKADPMNFVAKLSELYLSLQSNDPNQLVAGYQTISTMRSLTNFDAKQTQILQDMQKVILAKMKQLAHTENHNHGTNYGPLCRMFAVVVGYATWRND